MKYKFMFMSYGTLYVDEMIREEEKDIDEWDSANDGDFQDE